MMSVWNFGDPGMRNILPELFDALPGPGILSRFNMFHDQVFLFIRHPFIGDGVHAFGK